MRILQSVEVDEENEEYINAKRKQQQKFKGRLESIFDKYGSMHESMSDEIDMKLNRVVVDRGHLRRLKRQVNRKETMLLDTLGLTVGHEPEEQCEEEEEKVEDVSCFTSCFFIEVLTNTTALSRRKARTRVLTARAACGRCVYGYRGVC